MVGGGASNSAMATTPQRWSATVATAVAAVPTTWRVVAVVDFNPWGY